MLQGAQKYLYFSQPYWIAVSKNDDKIKFVV